MTSRALVTLIRASACWSLAALLSTAASGQGASSFVPLPLLPNGYFSPAGVSADGNTVVGGSYVAGQGNKAMRWRSGIGFDNPSPDPTNAASWSSGVSADGTVISGGQGHAVFGDLEGWMRYGNSVGHVGSPSGQDTSDCRAVSSNGMVSVGYGGKQSNPNVFQAARYTEQGDWVNMGYLSGGNNSKALGVNANGSVIVGWSNDAALSVSRAFRWTAATGMLSLGNLPDGDECVANGTSADGSVVVGSDYVVDAQWNSTQTAWRWTAATGMQSLGQLPGGQASEALAVSPDGAVIVGWAEQGGSTQAFVWDAAHGLRKLKDVLQQQGVPGLGGWSLDAATGIAGAAPYAIAGTGADTQGLYAGWVAHFDPGGSGSWTNLGSGLAGSAGVPQLSGTGSLVAGSSVTVTLGNAKPNALALLFVSTSSSPVPFKGGTLIPVPILAQLALVTSSAGGVVLPISPWPAGLPSGSAIFWQYGIQDPGAVHGVALANALKATLP